MSQDKVKTELQPHVHAEVIIAWAMGARIQHSFDGIKWEDCTGNPSFSVDNHYRVKPKPPKDIELYANAEMYKGTDISYAVLANELVGNFSTKFISTDNLKLTFCGVTGKLLLAEVVVHPSAGEDDNDF
jgi:hypothetical protein